MAKKKAVLTNGTMLYIVDPDTPGTVHKLCISALEVNEGTPTKIDVTTLCEKEKVQEVDGLLGSSETTMTINLDFANETHKMLIAARKDKRELRFRVGQSDGTNDATYSSDAWEADTTRTWIDFTGNVSSIPLSYQVNAALQPQITINMTSAYSITYKA